MADETSPTVIEKETRVASVSLRAAAAPAIGDRIGKYVVERTIGSGGMGTVVAARHEQIGEVAIKILHPKGAKDKIQVERFLREARAITKIKSEHVVRVFDAGQEEGGCPYIVMELLQGEDIAHVLKKEGHLAPDVAVDVMLQVCEAVASMHAQGIIHRDLKPSNFFLTRAADGTALVKVLDFGISKAIEADPATDPKLTETQAVFGSPTYMSPEQIRSAKHVDARSDVWSLGVSMFEMLTGKVPFVADNVPGILASIVADAPFRVATFVEGVPAELEAIVLTCLEKDPARRISSPAELAQHLGAFASEEGKLLVERIDRIARGVAAGPQAALASRPPPRLARPSTPPPLSSARGLSSGSL